MSIFPPEIGGRAKKVITSADVPFWAIYLLISGRNRAFDSFIGFEQWVSGSGQENSLASNFAPNTNGFSRKKHSFQHIFVSKKDIPVPAASAVTIIV